jgi:hypothetical protein
LKISGYTKLAQEIEDLEEIDEKYFESEPISEDEYLKKIHPVGGKDFHNKMQSHPPFERGAFPNILKKEDFHPVEAGGKSIILGQGSFGTVFRGVYQGKPAVAKVILYEDGIKEVKNWEDILDASSSVVPALKKYLPKIYKINYQEDFNKIKVKRNFWDDDDDDDSPSNSPYKDVLNPENNYAIIIMEELMPLDNNLLSKIVGNDSTTADKSPYQNPDFLWDVTKEIVEGILDYFDLNETDLSNIIFKILMNLDFKSNVYTITNQFKKELEEKLINAGHDLEFFLPSSVESLFYKILNPVLPTSGNDRYDIPYFKHLPETSGFITSLEDLEDLTGLKWDDLVAPRNLMMDRNGQLKLIDPGLYGYDF